VRIKVRADRTEFDLLALDERTVKFGGRDHGMVPARFQAEGEADVGVEVPERAEGRDHDTLTHDTLAALSTSGTSSSTTEERV
jgi:hypothetical protein